ncbi:MAG TPA: hypothetical protein VM820_04800 [Vicinamibacterales bacterium]|nr:hypothetical protein [Vicinamibacterales bacterium]
MSLWDDFTGASQRRDIRAGRDASLGALSSGMQAASGQLDEGYTQAMGLLNPLVASGRGYQSMMDDLMGLNGPEARARAQGVVSSDPLWAGQLGNEQMAAQRALNARGLGGSGTAALAGQRVLTERYGDVLNRYQQGAQQGASAAGAGADLSARYGSERAGLTYGNAQQVAGVQTGAANALSASRGTLMNNLMGLGSLAVSAMTPGLGGISAAGNMAKGLNSLWGAGATGGGVTPVSGAGTGTYTGNYTGGYWPSGMRLS